jgi:predicted TIM-barrel fold metal-dependent hydrolase
VAALEKWDETTFVWAHCGVSRRVVHPHYFAMVKEMLGRYDNLHVDLSWVVYEDAVCEPPERSGDPLIPKQVWIEDVIEPYADRVMLGSDLCGHFGSHGKTMARYNGLLSRLSPESRHKVARGNAERMYFRENG